MSLIDMEIQEIEAIIQDMRDTLQSISSRHVLYSSIVEDLNQAEAELKRIKEDAKKIKL